MLLGRGIDLADDAVFDKLVLQLLETLAQKFGVQLPAGTRFPRPM